MSKKIIFIITFLFLFCFVGFFAWWYSNKDSTPVTVLSSDAEQSLTFGWPTEVAKNPTPKATISDFNVDLTPIPVQGVSIPTSNTTPETKPGASSFSITDVIKPTVVSENTCVLPALLNDCCGLSGVNKNECIASIALARGLSSLCDYITGETAKRACINAITKPNSTTVDNSLVYIPKTTTVVPVITTTYTTNSDSNIDPTTYITDGSSLLSSLLANPTPNLPGWNVNTGIYSYPTSSIYTPNTNSGQFPTSSVYSAGGFDQRMSQKKIKLFSVASVTGAFLAHPGDIVLVIGEGFSTTSGNVLELKGTLPTQFDFKAPAMKSINGRTFSTIIPIHVGTGIYDLYVSREKETSTSNETTSSTEREITDDGPKITVI